MSEQAGVGTLAGRTLYIPDMSYAGSRLMAAAFRSIGIEAYATPPSNDETLELGGLHASGEECLPHKITLGDFLRICRAPGADPRKLALFMPRAPGPCRFGQYAPYLKQVLREQGLEDAAVFSPNSRDGYGDFGDHGSDLMRTAWMGIVCGDIATRLLLKTRPYEQVAGDADTVFEESVQRFAGTLERRGLHHKDRLTALADDMRQVRDRFRALPARYERGRPLIGLVGEIFCRLNTFSNEDTARRIERLGGECWLSDISEWVWYTNQQREADCVREQGRLNLDFLKLKLKSHVQHQVEHTLFAPVAGDFVGYEEPADVRDILACSQPYLPWQGALGEMTLSVGKAIYLHGKGADGIVDISPFTCMNGIASEAVYPAVSADHDGIPIRSLYFDKANANIERDLEIFLDLARAYQRRKKHERVYPDTFV